MWKVSFYGWTSAVFWDITVKRSFISAFIAPKTLSCTLGHRRTAANIGMHQIKTERRMERAKERDSTDIWVRLTERTAPQAGPSPSAPKMTHDCFDFCHPLSLYAPKLKPATNTEASAETHRLKDTHSYTVYCLDYIILIPGTWALLVGWHLGLCSSKVTFLCPWVKDACLQHAFEMKDGKGGRKIRWERFPKALWSEASTVMHKLVKQYVNLGWYWIKLPEWHESIVLRWSK